MRVMVGSSLEDLVLAWKVEEDMDCNLELGLVVKGQVEEDSCILEALAPLLVLAVEAGNCLMGEMVLDSRKRKKAFPLLPLLLVELQVHHRSHMMEMGQGLAFLPPFETHRGRMEGSQSQRSLVD